ncbi:heterokaryon incompatibility protein-domain-containing protein [Tricladium varicosporioides]|nr:heterokaryon incompatibility protein-domain-containing protein [Hymenoscyphus varicosporioides]
MSGDLLDLDELADISFPSLYRFTGLEGMMDRLGIDSARLPWYKYDRSLTSGSGIRLLRFKAASYLRDDLSCTVEYCSLDDQPQYEALSYTWGRSFEGTRGYKWAWQELMNEGRPEPTFPLYIDGVDGRRKLYQIGISLDEALRHIKSHARYESQDMVIWIDAICIDQRNEEEKNWQVQQMRRVYSQADRVVVWLGPSQDGSSKAMETLMSMRRFAVRTMHSLTDEKDGVQRVYTAPLPATSQEARDETTAASFGKLFGVHVPSNHEIPDFPIDKIAGLFSRAWWGRIWVLQEVVVARKVAFACGSVVTDDDGDLVFETFQNMWDRMFKVYGKQIRAIDHRPWTMIATRRAFTERQQLLQESDQLNLSTGATRLSEGNVAQMEAYLKGLRLEHQLSLKELIIEASNASLQATMGHDHIYALLGLASDAEDLAIPIRYGFSKARLFFHVAKAYLDRGDLWFLTYRDPQQLSRNPTWRSWMPDWSSAGHLSSISRPGNAGLPLDASIGRGCTLYEFVYRDGEDQDQVPNLKIQGVLVDVVEWVSDINPAAGRVTDLSSQAREEILSWVKSLFASCDGVDVASMDINDDTRKARRSNLCWSLIAGRIPLPRADAEKDPKERRRLVEQSLSTLLGEESTDEDDDEANQHRASCFFHLMMNMTCFRSAFRTANEYIGIGPHDMEQGDLIVIFPGAQTPFAIRKSEGEGEADVFRLIGEVYVNGIMDGEFFAKNPGVDMKSFVLE